MIVIIMQGCTFQENSMFSSLIAALLLDSPIALPSNTRLAGDGSTSFRWATSPPPRLDTIAMRSGVPAVGDFSSPLPSASASNDSSALVPASDVPLPIRPLHEVSAWLPSSAPRHHPGADLVCTASLQMVLTRLILPYSLFPAVAGSSFAEVGSATALPSPLHRSTGLLKT